MAKGSDFMMTAEELRLRRHKRRRLIFIMLAVLVAITIIAFAARPARNAIRDWQSRRHAQKAFVLIDQEKWVEARDQVAAAYQLQPTEPQALRALARLLSRT